MCELLERSCLCLLNYLSFTKSSVIGSQELLLVYRRNGKVVFSEAAEISEPN